MASLVAVGVMALAAASGPGLVVQGETTCPSSAQVTAALEGLVSTTTVAGASSDVVELKARAAAVNVRLVTGAGEFVGEKQLPPAAGCDERARAAAVIVAAWEARLRAGDAGNLDVPRAPAVAAAPSPPPPRASEPPTIVRASLPPPRAPWLIAPGAAFVASAAGGDLVGGAVAELAAGPSDAPWAVGVGGIAVDTHAMTVGTGQGSWRRLGGVVDARADLRLRPFDLELRAGVLLTAMSVSGRGFSSASSSTLFDPGALAALRVKAHFGRLTPWAEAAAVLWPAGHTLYVEGTTASADLPSKEALISLGASFEVGR
ncbi:MAG TPA: hypothetical protein VHJ20_15760 [Polyangia bacterium]|nr:hypothetical protein [Polyangia bacterium]